MILDRRLRERIAGRLRLPTPNQGAFHEKSIALHQIGNRSCDRQRDQLIAKFGRTHEIVGEYRDDGESGNMDRPALKELIADSSKGKIPFLLCADVTRLGRTCVFEVVKTLQDHGVRIVTIREGEIDVARLLVELCKLKFARHESTARSERIKAGIRAAKERRKANRQA